MSRITNLFEHKKERVLNVYCTAGFPERDSTLDVMEALQDNGADLIELGMPYSDPLADGPVIQASSARALANGMTIGTLFRQLEGFRERIRVPVVLMGYLNPVLQYGFEAFCSKAAEVGIDGLIIPDLPAPSFERQYREIVRRHGLDVIFLVTPETGAERVRRLDELSSGFLYAVSSSSLTGSDKDFSDVDAYLERLQAMRLQNPLLVGFGIRDRPTFEAACRRSNGAIIGSAYIQALSKGDDIREQTRNFLSEVLGK